MGEMLISETALVSKYVDEHKTTREISNEIGCSPPTVNKRLKRAGVKLRPSGHMIGKPISEDTKRKMSATHTGMQFSDTHRARLSIAKIGKPQPHMIGANNPMRRPEIAAKLSGANNSMKRPEVRAKLSDSLMGRITSEETREKLRAANIGNHHTDETKRKIGLATEGERHWNWRGGIARHSYCHKFNNRIKEEVREAFGRKCFICHKSESENGRKLDVHHCDYNKGQGCGQRWNLIPLCQHCHTKTTNKRHYYFNLLANYWLYVSGGADIGICTIDMG